MIRSTDSALWARLRAEARRRRWSTALVFEQAIRAWLDAHEGEAEHTDTVRHRAS